MLQLKNTQDKKWYSCKIHQTRNFTAAKYTRQEMVQLGSTQDMKIYATAAEFPRQDMLQLGNTLDMKCYSCEVHKTRNVTAAKYTTQTMLQL